MIDPEHIAITHVEDIHKRLTNDEIKKYRKKLVEKNELFILAEADDGSMIAIVMRTLIAYPPFFIISDNNSAKIFSREGLFTINQTQLNYDSSIQLKTEMTDKQINEIIQRTEIEEVQDQPKGKLN